MTEHEHATHAIDRTGWPAGVWDSEPDRAEWRAHGFPCLILRNELGALCGYVGVPPGHPLHGRDLVGAEDAPPLEVHGGITYAARCAGPICHVPRGSEPADVWWVGFDCGHAFDFMPGMWARVEEMRRATGRTLGPRFGTYRGISYVRAEVETLAGQLRIMAARAPARREAP